MSFITTVTTKGQITLPKNIRDFLGLYPKTRVTVNLDERNRAVKFEPIVNFLDFAGCLNDKVPKEKRMDAVEARAYMEKHYDGRI